MTNKNNNRANFPQTALIVDEFRKYFGSDVKLLYAKENGKEIGSKPVKEGSYLTADQFIALGKVNYRKKVLA